MRLNEPWRPEKIRRKERGSRVDDGDREAERPGLANQRDGVLAGAEDHQIRWRHVHLEEELGSADPLGSRLRAVGASSSRARRIGLALDGGVRKAADGGARAQASRRRPEAPASGVTSTAAFAPLERRPAMPS